MRGMFTRIAGMYDRLNRAQSLGLDVLWRKRALARLAREVPSPRRILDLATGTADFSDYLIGDRALAAGARTTLSFDEDACSCDLFESV